MALASKKKLANFTVPKSPLVEIASEKAQEKKPHIGITYLDKNKFGLKHFVKCASKNSEYYEMLQKFIEQCREYETLSEMVSKHQPHGKGPKNFDKESENKIRHIQREYKIDTQEMIHIHTKCKGKGEFVLHGFRSNDVFEIVWLDCKHEQHK